MINPPCFKDSDGFVYVVLCKFGEMIAEGKDWIQDIPEHINPCSCIGCVCGSDEVSGYKFKQASKEESQQLYDALESLAEQRMWESNDDDVIEYETWED